MFLLLGFQKNRKAGQEAPEGFKKQENVRHGLQQLKKRSFQVVKTALSLSVLSLSLPFWAENHMGGPPLRYIYIYIYIYIIPYLAPKMVPKLILLLEGLLNNFE